MPNVTQVTLSNGVPTAPSGTVSTLDNLIGTAGSPSTNVLTVQGNSTGTPLPVIDAFQSPSTASWTSSTTVNTALTLNTAGYDTVVLTIVPGGTITAGAITFEVNDGTNWVTVRAPRTSGYNTDSTFTLSGSPGTQSWQIPVAGYSSFRARLSTVLTGTSPTAALVGIVSASPDTSLVTVGLDPSQPLPAGTSLLGAVNLSQFNGNSIATGTGAGGAGIPRVTVSFDSKVLVWDGTNVPAVKAASTAPSATDPALVVALSPNGLPGTGRKTPANSSPTVAASQDYQFFAASTGSTAIIGQSGTTGAAGDYLDFIEIMPTSTTVGNVTLQDGSGTAQTIFTGGTLATTITTIPIFIRAVSHAGAWKITTGAGMTVLATGNFT